MFALWEERHYAQVRTIPHLMGKATRSMKLKAVTYRKSNRVEFALLRQEKIPTKYPVTDREVARLTRTKKIPNSGTPIHLTDAQCHSNPRCQDSGCGLVDFTRRNAEARLSELKVLCEPQQHMYGQEDEG